MKNVMQTLDCNKNELKIEKIKPHNVLPMSCTKQAQKDVIWFLNKN